MAPIAPPLTIYLCGRDPKTKWYEASETRMKLQLFENSFEVGSFWKPKSKRFGSSGNHGTLGYPIKEHKISDRIFKNHRQPKILLENLAKERGQKLFCIAGAKEMEIVFEEFLHCSKILARGTLSRQSNVELNCVAHMLMI